jgi:hypothetical protein
MDDVVKSAREALEFSYQFDKDNRKEAVEDLRFVAGFQWSDAARQERQGRPLITINRSNQFIRQVSNPIRQHMPTIKVEPDGDDQEQMADIANGLFRRIQYNSSASHVYANAVEHMVACGIGWWRVCTDYLNEEGFDQEILIKRVFNPLSVYPDPSSLEPDRSDMFYCNVSELWPNEAFKRKWPGRQLVSVDMPNNGSAQQAISWGSADSVRVSEFWQRQEISKQMAQLSTGDVVDIDLLQKVAPQYAEQIKPHIVNARSVKSFKVTMTLVSGAEVLEDPYECPCKWIPIVPVIGNEVPIEQGTYRHGLIRFQREPQQLHNYFMSVAAESLGQQPKAPYMATAKQIGKYKAMWDNANRTPTPYLLYDHDEKVPGQGPPQRIAPPPLPAGLIQMAQMLSDDMKATTGIYDAALGAQSNETSGVAIGQRVQQGDQATFHYVDNLEHGLEHTGRIILDMIPKVYDNERSMKLKGDGAAKEQTVTINKPIMQVGNQTIMHNDMSQMSFSSVRVVLGQNFASRKQQTSQILVGLLQAMPQVGAVAGDIIAKNLDIDQADELAERLHMLLPPPILQAEQAQEQGGQPGQAPPPAPQPTPEQQQMIQQQQAHEQAMALEQQAGQYKVQQEAAKAAAAAQAVQTEQAKTRKALLDGELVRKKLSEPPPERQAATAD